MKAYSQDMREIAISLFKSGYKRKQISKTLGIHYETTKDWSKPPILVYTDVSNPSCY